MDKLTFTVRVRVAWWVRWYVASIAVLARIHVMRPDEDKLARFIARRGVRCDVERSHG